MIEQHDSLAKRHLVPELMDALDLDPDTHRAALRGLSRLNALGGARRILWPSLLATAARVGRPLRVLDVACGGGDITIELARRARSRGLDLEISGCDRSPIALEHARALAASAALEVEFFQTDVLADGLPPDHDVIVCSQFLHHLSNQEAEDLLREMVARATVQVLICDLVRTRRNLWTTTVAAHTVSRSSIVHFDGPQSIRAAFTLEEIRDLAIRIGLADAQIASRFPVHFLLSVTRA